MLSTRIDTETAIVWAKTKTIDDLNSIIERNDGDLTAREAWRFGILIVIAIILATVPISDRNHLLPQFVRLGAFFAGFLTALVAVAPLQKSANLAATARYALKLKSELNP
jgi:hypothetical protein